MAEQEQTVDQQQEKAREKAEDDRYQRAEQQQAAYDDEYESRRETLSALALFDPFQDIVGGMFSIPAIVYYLSVIGLFLFLTGQALERRRWN